MEYDDTNRGILFNNDKQNEKQPDYSGKFNYKGQEFKIAGWVRTSSKTGKEFISLSVDDYVKPESNGYETFKQQGQALQQKTEDVVMPVPDGEIDLSQIPF